ncbi:hypothetical protein GCM10009193_10500 [Shewanella aestuarii]|nr:hypothetical protein GCM10009193_10500 [Shewanella aestuarii]
MTIFVTKRNKFFLTQFELRPSRKGRELGMDAKLAFVRPGSLFGILATVTFVNPFTSDTYRKR